MANGLTLKQGRLLIAAGDHLVLSGGLNIIDPDDPLKGPEWRAGGLLYLLNRHDGEDVRTISLPAGPVHEGLLAVPSGLFACLKNGSVVRLAKSRPA